MRWRLVRKIFIQLGPRRQTSHCFLGGIKPPLSLFNLPLLQAFSGKTVFFSSSPITSAEDISKVGKEGQFFINSQCFTLLANREFVQLSEWQACRKIEFFSFASFFVLTNFQQWITSFQIKLNQFLFYRLKNSSGNKNKSLSWWLMLRTHVANTEHGAVPSGWKNSGKFLMKI